MWIVRITKGEEMESSFTATSRYSNKERWVLFACPRGKITIDDGAEKALRSGKSLLPCGITSVEGKFRKGDVVRINSFAKAIVNVSSTDMLATIEKCKKNKTDTDSKTRSELAVISNENIVIHETAALE